MRSMSAQAPGVAGVVLACAWPESGRISGVRCVWAHVKLAHSPLEGVPAQDSECQRCVCCVVGTQGTLQSRKTVESIWETNSGGAAHVNFLFPSRRVGGVTLVGRGSRRGRQWYLLCGRTPSPSPLLPRHDSRRLLPSIRLPCQPCKPIVTRVLSVGYKRQDFSFFLIYSIITLQADCKQGRLGRPAKYGQPASQPSLPTS